MHAPDLGRRIAQRAGVPRIESAAGEHDVVEDAAPSLGATFEGERVGSRSPLTCFSFHSLKNMTTGEGGMLTTNNDTFAEEAPLLRTMGVKSYDNQTDYWLPYHYDVVTVNGESENVRIWTDTRNTSE